MGINVGVEMSVGEYLELAPEVISKNEYQRKKVKSAGKTYDLLRKDLLNGCIMPPIILAVTDAYGPSLDMLVRDIIANGNPQCDWHAIDESLTRAIYEKEILILDGLQRSLTLLGISENEDLPIEDRSRFYDHPIRTEIYVGLSKTGILYRMLTLNTGQTPMSFRHQLEILYYDYIDNSELPEGITVLKEVEERRARGAGRYKYNDVIDMFYAYSTGSAMPYDKQALVSQLREIDFLESFSYHEGSDEMKSLLINYHHLVEIITRLSFDWAYAPEDDEGNIARPFGTNVPSILARTQPMSGFGAEVKRLQKNGIVGSDQNLDAIFRHFNFSEDPETSLEQLLMILDNIAKTAKRIGDAQRAYFQYAFRALLLPESEAFGDLSKCWLKGQEDFEMMYG
jgi:hypothetical protein